MTTNLPFLRWLVAHPVVRAGRDDDRVPHRAPAALGAARAVARRPWDGAWRLNLLPPPDRTPPPDVDDAATHRRAAGGGEQSALTAPMPGTVIKVLAAPGDRVGHRQTLLVLEAMKMETPVVSPYDAVVRAVHVTEGDRVAGGAVLVELED